jgi:hypothetical protein
MKRIFFHSTAQTIFRHAEGVPHAGGTPPTAASTLSYLKKSFSLTGNKGNMIHSEAVLKLFTHNHSRSVVSNISNVHRAKGADFTDYMRERFDCIVLSIANFIRRHQSHERLVEALKATDLPLYVFSAGMQEPLPPDLSLLSPATVELLHLYNERAEIFALRGISTQRWLDSVGIRNTVVIGCPSLYVYPRRILSVPPISSLRGKQLLTAGHVSENNISGTRKGFTRGFDIIEIMQNRNADYVFQDEPFHFSELMDTPLIYDDSLNEFDSDLIREYIRSKFGIDLPFRRYLLFQDVSAWRQAASNYDVYIGDRFHGGVVCLQAGRPALVIASDQRMAELAAYFGIPHTSFKEIKKHGLDKVVARTLSEDQIAIFRTTYLGRLRTFSDVVRKHGMELANDAQIQAALALSVSVPAPRGSA